MLESLKDRKELRGASTAGKVTTQSELFLNGLHVKLNELSDVSNLDLREGHHDAQKVLLEQLLVELFQMAVDDGVLAKL